VSNYSLILATGGRLLFNGSMDCYLRALWHFCDERPVLTKRPPGRDAGRARHASSRFSDSWHRMYCPVVMTTWTLKSARYWAF
jgi:hypothetical protein